MTLRLWLAIAVAIGSATPIAAQTPTPPTPLRNVTRTMYTPRTELFAEFRPLIVGESVRITAHLTKMGAVFRPYAEGTVKLTLTVDSAETGVTATGPERAGVFRLPITPTRAGTGRIVIEMLSLQPPERFVLDGVPVYADARAALAKEVAQETGLISYAKERSWEADFATAPVVVYFPGAGGIAMVPAAAIVRDGGVARVYVQRTPERFELREVKTRRTIGDLVEVTGDLRQNERIVVRGVDKMPRQ